MSELAGILDMDPNRFWLMWCFIEPVYWWNQLEGTIGSGKFSFSLNVDLLTWPIMACLFSQRCKNTMGKLRNNVQVYSKCKAASNFNCCYSPLFPQCGGSYGGSNKKLTQLSITLASAPEVTLQRHFLGSCRVASTTTSRNSLLVLLLCPGIHPSGQMARSEGKTTMFSLQRSDISAVLHNQPWYLCLSLLQNEI